MFYNYLFKKYLVIVLALMSVFFTQQNSASTVFLSLDQITEFEQINLSNTDGFSFATHQNENGVVFLTYFVLQSGQATADVGTEDAHYDWSQFDTYNQSIYNYDENAWTFSVSVADIDGNIVSSDPVSIPPEENNIFSLDLLSLSSREIIDEVWVTVSGDIPLPGNDAVSEWELSFGLGSAAEVPLPPAFLLYSLSIMPIVLSRYIRKD